VRLRRAALSEHALAICKHGIIVAKVVAGDFASRNLFDKLA
jgi:hypothetical protein